LIEDMPEDMRRGVDLTYFYKFLRMSIR